MNLALVISSLSTGGAERVMSQLANFWAARGDAITLITLDSRERDSYALDPRVRRVALGMHSHSGTALKAIANNCRRLRALRRAIAGSGADVLLSFEDRTNVLMLLATLGRSLRRVISERIDPRQHSIGPVWTVLRRLLYPLADVLVVQTAALLPWGSAAMLGARRVEVIPNPVREMEPFARVTDTRSEALVAAGRLVSQKGYDILITAFARVAPEYPSWTLTILGEGTERGRLARLAEELGVAHRVALQGWLAEPGEVMSAASVFVMSSHYEGFPNALLEAMACGLAVISTDWAGAGEMVTDGLDGLIVRIGSTEELAGAMRRLMQDEDMRKRLGQNARAVSDRFSLASVTQKWAAVLASPVEP